MRQIRKAVHAGYCWGVERALDIVNQTAETHKEVPVRTLGPIIHIAIDKFFYCLICLPKRESKCQTLFIA